MIIVAPVHHSDVYNAIIVILVASFRGTLRGIRGRIIEIAIGSMGKRWSLDGIGGADFVRETDAVVPVLVFGRESREGYSKEESCDSVQNAVRRVTAVPARYRTRATRTSARRATAVCTDPV